MRKLRGEAANVHVVLFNSMGVALTIHSGFGISAFSSVPFAFNLCFPSITIGTWNYMFQFALVLVLMALRKEFVPSYFLSFIIAFFFGTFLDIHELWIRHLPLNIPLGLIYFVFGNLLIAIGIALENRSRLVIMPTDLFSRDLSEITGFRFARVKITFDVTCLAITAAVTLLKTGRIQGIGIGTAVMAFCLGKIAASIGTFLDRHFIFYNYKDIRTEKSEEHI